MRKTHVATWLKFEFLKARLNKLSCSPQSGHSDRKINWRSRAEEFGSKLFFDPYSFVEFCSEWNLLHKLFFSTSVLRCTFTYLAWLKTLAFGLERERVSERAKLTFYLFLLQTCFIHLLNFLCFRWTKMLKSNDGMLLALLHNLNQPEIFFRDI